ncbi:RICIN domain-containing protein [Streptomyces sp. MCAF7]
MVESGRVRAVVQRVPYNNGAAVAGPETVSDTALTVNGNAVALSIPWSNAQDGYTVTLLPPSDTTVSTVAVSQNSGQCLDDTDLSTADGTQYQQYDCEGGYQQMLDLKPVVGRVGTYTVVNELSRKYIDVSNVSTRPRALIHQWICGPASALGTKKNQIWRLLGKA